MAAAGWCSSAGRRVSARQRLPQPWLTPPLARLFGAVPVTMFTTAEALGPILDALPELAVAVDHEAGVSRLRLFQKVRDVLAESPMLLLLEDVHWADEATLDILRFLGRGWREPG